MNAVRAHLLSPSNTERGKRGRGDFALEGCQQQEFQFSFCNQELLSPARGVNFFYESSKGVKRGGGWQRGHLCEVRQKGLR